MEKKYVVNTTTSSIESYTYVGVHPENSNYVIVLDEYKNPQKMLLNAWNDIPILNYEDAKRVLILHLNDLIIYYSGLLINDLNENKTL